jgi:hypothetical protein
VRNRFGSLSSTLLLAAFSGSVARAQNVDPLTSGFCSGGVASSLVVTTSAALSTDADCAYVAPQVGGPDLCVFRYQDIQIAAAGVLTISGLRPAALTAQGTILVQGAINADQAGSNTGSATGVDTANASAGGGGAGGGTMGASGGKNSLGGVGGIGGSTVPPKFAPLIGGSHGGAGGTTNTALGGRGGGALQLAACGDLTLVLGAHVSTSGQGGSGGATAPASPNSGGGGGSGGTLILEGTNISITGNVTANGGGGGGGGTATASGQAGTDGRTDGLFASGGMTGGTGAGAGGSGGAASAPGPGGNASSSVGGAGGGGGAVGRIRFNACASLATPGAIVSPAATTGASCPSDRIFADGFD